MPEVDPEDLKALWQLQRDVEKQHPGQQSQSVLRLLSTTASRERTIKLLATASVFCG